jgi:hypothetical protein
MNSKPKINVGKDKAHVPDAFTNTKDGRGITWGLCHFRNIKRKEGKSHSMLARFDCDLSLDVHDLEMKESDIFNDPEINFKFGLSEKQRSRIEAAVKKAVKQSTDKQ